MHCLELAGKAQNKINNSILTSLVTTATDENKQLLNRDLGPRINDKIRTRKTDKRNLATDREQIEAAFELPHEYTQLENRAHHHVSRLKEKITRNQTYCTTDDDQSFISSLGLDQFDVSDSDSEDGEGLWPVQHQLPNLPSVATASLSVPTTTATPILYDTSSDTIMQSNDPSSNSNYSIPRTILPSNLVTPSLHLSSLQVAAHPPSSTPAIPAVDDMEWESPPAEILQEWIETSQTKTKSTKTNTRGPPGRLSPPNNIKSSRSTSSTNRYSVLEDLPLTRPPVDSRTPTLSKLVTSTLSGFGPHVTCSKQRKPAASIPLNQGSTPCKSPMEVQAIIDFYEGKRSKKGSPPRKKKKTRSCFQSR